MGTMPNPAAYVPATMRAVVTTGTGGYDRLVVKDVPVPSPGEHDVLLQVLAAGVNNTEINTRLGWYAPSVAASTADAAEAQGAGLEPPEQGGWNGATPFPLIQGTDCCGKVVAAGAGVDAALLGRRVLVRACMRRSGFSSIETMWLGSDFDGAFAQYVRVPATEIFPVDCDWSDAELASIPCAYGTAENLLTRAKVASGQTLLVTGASGGVGSAAVQLARRRGARVIAVVGADKADAMRSLGADRVVDRSAYLADAVADERIDIVVDVVAGPAFPSLLGVLERGGTYASSGAIGGPQVQLDMRTLYLKDLTLIGATAWAEPVFPNLVSYIERGEIRPLVAKTFALDQIALAQQEFLDKTQVGKFVLLPPVSA